MRLVLKHLLSDFDNISFSFVFGVAFVKNFVCYEGVILGPDLASNKIGILHGPEIHSAIFPQP